MIIGRIVGWLVLILAILAEGTDLWSLWDTGHYPLALGEFWKLIDPTSLQLAEAGIARYIAPWLWYSVILPILTWPAALTLAILGLVLIWLFRRRDRRRRR